MKSLSLVKNSTDLEQGLAEVVAFQPSFVIVFAAPSLFRDPAFADSIRQHLHGICHIGCSSAGEIIQSRIYDDHVVILACQFEHSEVRFAMAPILRAALSEEAGRKIGESLKAPDLKGVFILGPGLNVNGSALVRGVYESAGSNVMITGGMAGDNDRFQQTFTLGNGSIACDQVVALGFYGDAVHIGAGSDGGWCAFGPARRVTRAEGQILYELDGKPALQLYKEYLGDKARQLPASGLSYPFAIMNENRDLSGIIRTAMDIDHEKGSLILAGDMPQDSLVCLMHADSVDLTEGAISAAKKARQSNPRPEERGFVLAVSCVGRRLVMMLDAEDETEALVNVFGAGTPLVGFCSYGEIAPFYGNARPELHNQTMTITYVTES